MVETAPMTWSGEVERAKLLLVDDEPFNLDLLRQELGEESYEISTAANGQQALEQVQADPPDMIFLDLMMPVMDGFGVLEKLKADEELRSIPVVIISASDDIQSIARGIDMGAEDFLPKPFEPAILHARLRAGLAKKRLTDLEHLYLKSLARELEIGREIQAGFLPAKLPKIDGWRIDSYFKAAREVAGDFYDVFEIGPERLVVLLGDVTDKGVGSALYMALIRSLIRATILADQLLPAETDNLSDAQEIDHLRAVQLVNRYICRYHNSAMLATLFIGVLDTGSGEMSYISAGHDTPFLISNGGVERAIEPTGPIIGAFEEAEYQLGSCRLEPGAALVMYSDGIPDALNRAGQTFGAARLKEALSLDGQDDAELAGNLLLTLREFVGEAEPYDDISLLVVRRAA